MDEHRKLQSGMLIKQLAEHLSSIDNVINEIKNKQINAITKQADMVGCCDKLKDALVRIESQLNIMNDHHNAMFNRLNNAQEYLTRIDTLLERLGTSPNQTDADKLLQEVKKLKDEFAAEKTTDQKTQTWPGLFKYAIDKNLTLLVIIILLLALLAAMVGVTIKYDSFSLQPKPQPTVPIQSTNTTPMSHPATKTTNP